MSTIKQISYRQVSRPMKTLFATARGQKTVSTSLLVKVALSDGSSGTGEVPTSFVQPHETPQAIREILSQAAAEMIGTPIDDTARNLKRLARRYGEFHMTLSGLEVAAFRAELASRGADEHAHWGGRRAEIQTDITIPYILDGDMLVRWMCEVVKMGFKVYKVKVSGHVAADLQFVRAVQGMLKYCMDDYTIRLDGNQGYTDKTFLQMLDRLEKAKIAIELFEQPLARDDWAGLKRLRGRSSVPVILDETVFCGADCQRVLDEDLGDGVNIKIAKSGIAESAKILKMAKKAKKKLMIGCMTETMVGLSAGINLAAGTGAFDYVDLDSAHLMATGGRYGNISRKGCGFKLKAAAK